MAPVPTGALFSKEEAESSTSIRERVVAARERQLARFARAKIHCNAQMSTRQLKRYVPVSGGLQKLLEDYAALHQLSARAIHRACRVARTLADLDDRDQVTDEDVLLALTMQQARWVS